MLGRLVGDGHTRPFGELAGPHAGGVDDVLALDIALRRPHADDASIRGQHVQHGCAFEDRHAAHARALRQSHGRVNGVHPAVLRHVETGQQIISTRRREEVGNLARGDFMHLRAHEPIEGRDATVFLKSPFVSRYLDQTDRCKAR